ncbi:hypothetical protein OG21DRAFT_1496490 [Imleria badia]|nr:hypothetical protein OG21DRAFT_1496490 [Imleria badia]
MTGHVTVDINADYGSLILGGLLAFALSGCVNLQFIMYWQVDPEERWTTKSLLIATWILDWFHSAFIAIAIWDSVISPYGNLNSIDVIPWSVGPTVELTAMMTFLVQSFFAYRIYRLQNCKLMVAGPVFVLAFFRLVAASVSMAEMIILKFYSDFARFFPSWVFTLGLSLSAFVDVVVTTSLCYSLRSDRSLVPSTIIDTLSLWTVQTGSITCLTTIASLICWLVMPQNRIFLSLHFVVEKLYANTLLATLNARDRIRKSWKYQTTQVSPPITMLPEAGFGDESRRAVSRRSQQPHACDLDPFALQPVNLTRTRSIRLVPSFLLWNGHADFPSSPFPPSLPCLVRPKD